MRTPDEKGLLVFLMIPFFLFLLVSAVHAEDVKGKYRNIQKEIKKQEENLRQANQQESSISDQLQAINGEVSKYEGRLDAEKKRLASINRKIGLTDAGIKKTRQELLKHQNWLKAKLIGLWKNGQAQDIVMLLGADDMGSFLRRWSYLEVMAEQEKKDEDSYSASLNELQGQEASLSSLVSGLRREASRAALVKSRLDMKRQEKRNLLVSIRSQKASYEAMLEGLKEASRKLLAVINRSNISSSYNGKGFQGMKSRLPWPVLGTVVFRYGRGTDPVFGTPIFRNGIYIRTAANAKVRSIFEGKVIYADWFKGYGQLVIINHGGGYNSLYAGLNEIFLKVGDIIMGGAPVGRAGGSVMVNGPSLYFEVRYRGKPLDPMQWLARN
ncbi:MAG: peptidoglycan DD-metalloendopeptidase family protein [Nitrospiraceae bacterium]|nr:peptidoglycan DD-metalloendopeptidase family protein [Nitrospiraceae bacterium]